MLHRILLVGALITLLGGCTPLGLLDKVFAKPGIGIDATIGDTQNKVKTGIGTVGNTTDIKLEIEDSKIKSIRTATGRYHLEATESLTVYIYEANKYVLPVVLIYLLLKAPVTRAIEVFIKRRRKDNT